ncbi:MAG: hypothetical protein KDD11_10630 [Acidobacteria bacterium]|nr:hypothetical protein [Acidobacteriota bacterium]
MPRRNQETASEASWTEARPARQILGALVMTLVVSTLLAPPAQAVGVCLNIANVAFKACQSEIADDFWTAAGVCANNEDADARADCLDDARSELGEGRDLCSEQRDARRELCRDLDENRYDPDFDPADFATEFTNQNPYFPLAPGNTWEFIEGEETITVEVLDAYKSIEGVTAIVVHDLVEEDGKAIEDTNDWYTVATNGDVYYVGESVQNFELFDGDDPDDPELVDVDGSWKTGRDGAKPGIQMFASPAAGTFYRQEIALGDAEDSAEILATDYSYGEDAELDAFVPQELAELLCDGDCLVIREFTPIEPGAEGLKYYAPGVGQFLEVKPDSGDTSVLVSCNVDPRCAMLPEP